jgi:hypothetical protein
MSAEAKRILSVARVLISKPTLWTQKVYSRDKDGDQCDPLKVESVCFCSLGALRRTAFSLLADTFYSEARNHLQQACELFGFMGIPALNDNSDHATVLKMFDKAIELAGEEK